MPRDDEWALEEESRRKLLVDLDDEDGLIDEEKKFERLRDFEMDRSQPFSPERWAYAHGGHAVGTEEDLKANREWLGHIWATGHVPHEYLALIVTPETLGCIETSRRESDEAHRAEFAAWKARRTSESRYADRTSAPGGQGRSSA